jgi:hypothetical protein
MGVDRDVVFAATVTAEEAFALPGRLNSAPAVVAAHRAYHEHMNPGVRGVELESWHWDSAWPQMVTTSSRSVSTRREPCG